MSSAIILKLESTFKRLLMFHFCGRGGRTCGCCSSSMVTGVVAAGAASVVAAFVVPLSLLVTRGMLEGVVVGAGWWSLLGLALVRQPVDSDSRLVSSGAVQGKKQRTRSTTTLSICTRTIHVKENIKGNESFKCSFTQ